MLFLGLGFGGLLLIPAILTMHFLMPNAILERYWRQPHFRPAELALFTNTLFAPMRTVMFMWLFLFPDAGRKRQITNIRELTPRWYRLAAVCVDVCLLITAAALIALAIGFDIYWEITGQA